MVQRVTRYPVHRSSASRASHHADSVKMWRRSGAVRPMCTRTLSPRKLKTDRDRNQYMVSGDSSPNVNKRFKMHKKKIKTDTVCKRSKNEVVRATLGSYLKRRNYTTSESLRLSETNIASSHGSDSSQKFEFPLLLSREQMAISTAIQNDVTRNNSILYSCINNDTSQVDLQFTKLKTWIQDLSAVDCRSELVGLIVPLFCHLYLEMLHGSNRQAATKFLKRYQSTFNNENGIPNNIPEVIEELSQISSIQDVNLRPIVKTFRSCKYQCQLSPKTMSCLKKYLAVQGHVILFQVLQAWFDLEIPVTSNGHSGLEEEEDDNKTDVVDGDVKPCLENLSSTSSTDVVNAVPSGDGMRELQEAIRLLKEEPVQSVPMLLLTVVNSNQNLSSACVSHSQRVLVAGCLTSEVRVYRLPGSRNLGQDTPIVTNNPIAHIKLACDDILSPRETCQIGFDGRHCEALRGHNRAVYDVAFVPEADAVVSVSADCTMRAWNMHNLSCAAVYRGHNYPIYSVDVSTMSVYVATASHDRTARLWSLDRTFCLRIFAGHQQEVNVVKFHPNGSYLATASADKTVRLWSVADGKMVRVFPGHKGSVYTLAFSHNGKFIASAGEDTRIRIWDLAEGSIVADLKGHSEAVTGLQWIPGCDAITSCSTDAIVRTWGVNSPLGSESYSSDVLTCDTGCLSLLNLQYTHRNTLACIGTL